MSKKSRRLSRAARKGPAATPEDSGRYQILCPQTGTPVFTTSRHDAVEVVMQLGTQFFYEMDNKGPFFESPVWVWMLELDPNDEDSVIAVRHSFENLAAAHDEAPCGTIH